MKKILFIAIIAITAVAANSQEIVENQVLVELADDIKIGDVINKANQAYNNAAQIKVKKVLNANLNIYLLSHINLISEQELVDKLYQYSGVLNAQLNHKVDLRETTPLDPEYGNQWHHENIASELAWDITTGGLTAVGDEIVVCVIEGGNAQHEDLQDNAWSNTQEIADNGIDDDGNGYIDDVNGWNVGSDDDEGVFQGGHGTQVMGMIGAKGDNDIGLVGANWTVKIMSVAGENISNEASLVEAYGYPLDMRNLYEATAGAQGAFVVATNASWGIDGGDPDDSPIWCGLYQTLGEAGILSCGATANNNVDIDAVGDLPTACASDYMISVTATNDNDVRTFSAYGQTTIDLGAPGDNVWTTSGTNGYGATSGTSFASPLTAGVIGLLYSVPCPGLMDLVHADPQAGADLIRQALLDGVDQVDNLTTECVTGGRVNSFNSLNILLASCPEGACYAPFSSTLVSADNVSFAVEWAAFNEESTFGFRYKLISDTEWTEALELSDPSFDLGELEWCSEYEYQIKTVCSEEEETAWTNSSFIETDGCCVSPELETLSMEVLSDTEAAVTWINILAAEGYNLVYGQFGGSSTTIENIEGGIYTLSGLEPCTDYEISIYSVCEGGVSIDDNLISFRTTGCGHCTDAAFCELIPESSEDEFIQEFSINDYSNNSGNDGGYGDYTGSEIFLNRGSSSDLEVEVGYGGQTYNESIIVWIDYNQDGDFSANEIVASENSTSTGLQDTFTVLEDALLGITRIRVSVVWAGNVQSGQDPCGEYEYGETEDYCVTIEEFDSVKELGANDISIYPNPASSELIVNSTLINSSFNILDLTGRIVLNGVINSTNQAVNIESLTTGTYVLSISDNVGTVSQSQFVKM